MAETLFGQLTELHGRLTFSFFTYADLVERHGQVTPSIALSDLSRCEALCDMFEITPDYFQAEIRRYGQNAINNEDSVIPELLESIQDDLNNLSEAGFLTATNNQVSAGSTLPAQTFSCNRQQRAKISRTEAFRPKFIGE